jgi:hypothetical protein
MSPEERIGGQLGDLATAILMAGRDRDTARARAATRKLGEWVWDLLARHVAADRERSERALRELFVGEWGMYPDHAEAVLLRLRPPDPLIPST